MIITNLNTKYIRKVSSARTMFGETTFDNSSKIHSSLMNFNKQNLVLQSSTNNVYLFAPGKHLAQRNVYQSNYKKNIFDFITDNFVLEADTVSKIIYQLFSRKVSLSTLNSYIMNADKFMDIKSRLLTIDSDDFGHRYLQVSLVLNGHNDKNSKGFDKYIEDYLFPRRNDNTGFDITVR